MNYCAACIWLLFLTTISGCLCSSTQTLEIHKSEEKEKQNQNQPTKHMSLWKLNACGTAYDIDKNNTGQVTRSTFITSITILTGKVLLLHFLSAWVVAISSSVSAIDMC